MEFEWDPDKAASNLRKHHLSFAIAIQVFFDPDRWEEFEAGEEDRWLTVALVQGVEITVVYTIRNEVYRIISARKATLKERQKYWHG